MGLLIFQDCTRAYLINLLSASPLGNLFLCSHLCSHSVPIICWMLFKVAFLPPSGKYMANDVDGRPTSGNPDDTCNLLQPIKCALRPFISGELHSTISSGSGPPNLLPCNKRRNPVEMQPFNSFSNTSNNLNISIHLYVLVCCSLNDCAQGVQFLSKSYSLSNWEANPPNSCNLDPKVILMAVMWEVVEYLQPAYFGLVATHYTIIILIISWQWDSVRIKLELLFQSRSIGYF